jgi:2,4-dienoyl-CoA reductase-like NADH-dependent reductase (Old Yellow Enzyme family)
MENQFQPLMEPITLPNGTVLPNRLAMSPMVVKGSNEDGTITELDLAYFEKRSDVAGLIITGATYVNDMACGFDGQISISKDEDIEGLRKLAATAKKDGNKVIVQLHHAGREGYFEKLGKVVAPSALNFSFLPHIPEELTSEEIEETIKDFGRAAKRAIEAGFDGVEIHGANHYLLQQFFSAFSNQRTDEWGGSLEKRMAFPLAVVREVRRVVEESGKQDFIIGYRISPEEIHGETVGYTIEESKQLIEHVVNLGVDYLHVSLFTGYQATVVGSVKSYGEEIKEVVNGRCPVIIVSNVFTAKDALNALNYGDIVAIGRAALIEPQFAKKIRDGLEQEIVTSAENGVENLAIPKKAIEWLTMEGSPLPPLPGLKKEEEVVLV